MSELQNSKALERLRQNGISNPKELLQNTSSINIVIESNCHSRVLKNARAFILYESMIAWYKFWNNTINMVIIYSWCKCHYTGHVTQVVKLALDISMSYVRVLVMYTLGGSRWWHKSSDPPLTWEFWTGSVPGPATAITIIWEV